MSRCRKRTRRRCPAKSHDKDTTADYGIRQHLCDEIEMRSLLTQCYRRDPYGKRSRTRVTGPRIRRTRHCMKISLFVHVRESSRSRGSVVSSVRHRGPLQPKGESSTNPLRRSGTSSRNTSRWMETMRQTRVFIRGQSPTGILITPRIPQ
jgi:hypothetical protein